MVEHLRSKSTEGFSRPDWSPGTSASADKFDLGAVELDLGNGTSLLRVRVIPSELVHDDDVAVEEGLLQGREAALRLGADVHPARPCQQLAKLEFDTFS